MAKLRCGNATRMSSPRQTSGRPRATRRLEFGEPVTKTTTLTIRRGLRRLEFQRSPESSASDPSHVIVEFATTSELEANQVVQINLGIREGIERLLAGDRKSVV